MNLIYRAVTVLVVCIIGARADRRWIVGTYRNYALGYSIQVPRGLKGLAGEDAGPERGVKISLPSGGEIVPYAEPNSLEYRNPADGVRDYLRFELERRACSSVRQEVSTARVGTLTGAKGSLFCEDRVVKTFLVFRPRGGPIYWLQLRTVPAHESGDTAVLEKIAASFRLIAWR